MSYVTVRGATAATLAFDTRDNEHISRQLAEALRRHHVEMPRPHHGIVEITIAEAIRAGIVHFVHFDWDDFQIREQD